MTDVIALLNDLERELDQAGRSYSLERQKAARVAAALRAIEAQVEQESAAQGAFPLHLVLQKSRLDASYRARLDESGDIKELDKRIVHAMQETEAHDCEIRRLRCM